MKKIVLACFIAAALASCTGKSDAQHASAVATPTAATVVPGTTPAAPAPATPATAGSGTAGSAFQLTGQVLEARDAAGYTYVRLKTAEGEKWAAVAQTKVAKGSTVTVDGQLTIDNFESKTLDRKFDKIVFGTIGGANTPATPPAMMSSAQMPAGHPAVPGGAPAMGTAAQHMAGPATTGAISVPKAEGPDAKTVEEAWAGKSALADKPVVIRGKVVKFLGGIMGKNWVHVRDGSGSREAGTDDITVTTDDVAAAGEVVVIRGTLRVDKDFGAGYRYPVIVEDAKIVK